jgi:hypothetical protein
MTESVVLTTQLAPPARSESGYFKDSATPSRRLLKMIAANPRPAARKSFPEWCGLMATVAAGTSQMPELAANLPDLS